MVASAKKKPTSPSSNADKLNRYRPVGYFFRTKWRLLSVICFIIGVWLIFPLLVKKISGLAGCSLENIQIHGLKTLERSRIIEVLGLQKHQDLFLLNLPQVQDTVAKLPWVNQVIVQRILPHNLHIYITEHQEFAYWEHEGNLYIVSPDGTYILLKGPIKSQWLRLQSACPPPCMKRIQHLQTLFPSLHITTLRFLRRGRWDIHLKDGCVIKLPIHHKKKALERYHYLRNHPLLHHQKWLSIDLRLPGCAFIRFDKSAKTPKTTTPQKTIAQLNHRPHRT